MKESKGKKGWILAAGIVLGTAIVLPACDNQANSVGEEVLPGYTKMTAHSQSYTLDLSTVSADMKNNAPGTPQIGTSYNNIYVNSTLGYLGSIPNAEFGGIDCEYLTQVYAPRSFKFRAEPINHKIDSAFISLYYDTFSGDSIAPIEITAYQLQKSLPFEKYSISDVSEYVSERNFLGKTSYHANRGHGRLSNGLRYLRIPFPLDKAQDIYNKSRASDPIFSSQEAFDQYFPGIYIRTSAGMGSVIRVMNTSLSFFYSVNDTVKRPSTGVKDSVIIAPRVEELTHTSEVPQLSRFANEGVGELLLKSKTEGYSYIKSPAGVLTEVVIPTTKIHATLQAAPEGYERVLNSVHIQIAGERQEHSEYALLPPNDLLLLPRDSVANFFEKEKTELNNPYTAFISTRVTAGSLIYDFGNITSVIIEHIKKHPDKDMTLWLIPVDRTQDNNDRSPTYRMTTSISNLVLPSALKISTDQKNREIRAIFTQRKKGKPF